MSHVLIRSELERLPTCANPPLYIEEQLLAQTLSKKEAKASTYKAPPLPDGDSQFVKEESDTFNTEMLRYLTSIAPPSTSASIPVNVQKRIITQ
jgi:hypothetical protein